MPQYFSNKTTHTSFQRSTQQSTFHNYDYPDMAICWIDLLGVRSMAHAQITAAVDVALNAAAEGSSTGAILGNGTLIGKPNEAIQCCLVGDALVLSERDRPQTRAAATLAFLYRVNIISALLNARGLVHRGVITVGEVKCLQFEGAPIITGRGVVKAANLERDLKAAGLFYDEPIANFIRRRQSQIDLQEFCTPFSTLPNWNSASLAPGLSGVCFSQFQGWESWVAMVNAGTQNNDKIANAQTLIAELRRVYGLP